jgi:hypothetical protein
MLINPPTYAELNGPLIFLAGPIQGAPDWHAEALRLLRPFPGIHIANPKLPEDDLESGTNPAVPAAARIDWEHHYLERAGAQGVLLFWLPREAKHFCDRAYAQTSRFELGEAVTRHRWQGINVVVGVETGFTNARYLRQTIGKKAPGIPLCSTLTETCAAALALLTTAER